MSELESTFIKVNNTKNSNIIIGIIYKYASIVLDNFDNSFLRKLLESF